jgi:hypothetical protein
MVSVGAVNIMLAIKDGERVEHPLTATLLIIGGLLGSALGISFIMAYGFTFSFGYYLQMLGWTSLFMLFVCLVVAGLMALVEYLG